MNYRSMLYIICNIALIIQFLYSISAIASDDLSKIVVSDLELICLTEQPVIIEGESATLKVWASSADGRPFTTPIKFKWTVDAGYIETQTSTTLWDLSAVRINPYSVRKVIATVKATHPNGTGPNCAVEIFIGSKKRSTIHDNTYRGEHKISTRNFLLPGDVEETGYGLYSYLLFSVPPKDIEEKTRYLKTIEAYLLRLHEVEDYLRRHVRSQNLNITYIPLTKVPHPGNSNIEYAQNILADYDYVAAQVLLRGVYHAGHQKGPFLLSVFKPLSMLEQKSPYLLEDLTGITPELVWDWIGFFTYLAAQERSWHEHTLQRFGLNVRNLISIGSKVTPDIRFGLKEAIH